VEYNISGLNQVEVRTKIGLSFETIIRTMLRQAPDIILVGEIRDLTTAEAATMAALTGHLVFSTLHTNDAPSSLARLADMGIKRFLISSAIQAIMAQRLVRVICDHCKQEVEPDRKLASALGMTREEIEENKFYAGVGCEHCSQTGYRGRMGIFELMEMTSTIREMVFEGAETRQIREQARLSGMVTLKEDAVRKVFGGQTTLDEVVRVTAGDVLLVTESA
jgi:type II secretory ATPase GspE/PulE/Tfp pilus assembly ATPase PilB-like protein